MGIYWCKKHEFCPINGTLRHCLAQNSHLGCVNLILLPTEHPKKNNQKYISKRGQKFRRGKSRNRKKV
jgi:hypothetical protein